MQKHIDILIKGSVNNRGYVLLAMKEADKLFINGFATYTDDNNIFIEAEGYEPQLEKLIEWCKQERFGAEIKEVIVNIGEMQYYKTFEMGVSVLEIRS
jgi:acylphosphatase